MSRQKNFLFNSIKKSKLLFAFFFILLLQNNLLANSEKFKELFADVTIHDWNAYIKKIDLKLNDTKLKEDDKYNLYFAKAKALFELSKYNEALPLFEKSIHKKSNLLDYKKFYYAQTLLNLGKESKALDNFDFVIKFKPRSHLYNNARWGIAKIKMKDRKVKNARYHLRYLERRMRSDSNYPELIWDLAQVERKRNNLWWTCRWVKKLYRKYPTHNITKNWNLNSKFFDVNGKNTKCSISASDKKTRIRRLLWNGQKEKAEQEIASLREAVKVKDKYGIDLIYAQFLIQSGNVQQALDVLLPYYESQQWNAGYLGVLAKASAKMGEYTTAVGSYYRAHKLRPRSRQGKYWLYHSAFLSYQFQDYDGATRKFEEFVNKYKSSGLSRDAQWHIAWLKYLKADYKGAYKKFSYVWERRKRFGRSRNISYDKIQYWMAMSLYKMKKFAKAKDLFSRIAEDKHYSFYSLAAKSRLSQITTLVNLRSVASANDDAKDVIGQLDEDKLPKKEIDENDESEENLSLLEDSAEEEEEKKQDEEEEKEEKIASDNEGESKDIFDKLENSKSSNKNISLRFSRATELIQLGFFELARWELYGIEKRTRNKSYLKTLMEAYVEISAYHRSAHISQSSFFKERGKQGIDGARKLWDYSYPQAYRVHVEENAKLFNVPAEFIWAIIRAESMYREKVFSPVGARGLMQLMPFTAEKVAHLLGEKDFDKENLLFAKYNIRYGTRYLNRLGKKFENKLPMIAAAYNAGPHRVDTWLYQFGHLEMDEFIEHIPFLETRNYVKKVIKNYHVYELLRGKDQKMEIAWLSKPVGMEIATNISTKESWD